MKKNFIFIAVACATLSFSSCKKEAKLTVEPATEQAVEQQVKETSPTETVATNGVDEAINEYEKLTDELATLTKDVKAGKADAIKKMQELSTKYQDIATKFKDTSSYTPAQIERLNKIAQKYMAGIQ